MGKRLAFFSLIICLAGVPVFSQESGTGADDSGAPAWVVDVNPLMWVLSSLADANNNRSVYFDMGVQFAVADGLAIRINPAFSIGFTGETAFSDAQTQFFDAQLPIGLMCFPVTDVPAFFAISLTPGYYHASNDADDDVATFVSIGAIVEIGYQLKLTDQLVFTPSIGVARVYPIPIGHDGAYTAPHYNLFSPWPMDTQVSPRIRLALGLWL
jgi:hypothetical protein